MFIGTLCILDKYMNIDEKMHETDKIELFSKHRKYKRFFPYMGETGGGGGGSFLSIPKVGYNFCLIIPSCLIIPFLSFIFRFLNHGTKHFLCNPMTHIRLDIYK